MCWSSSTSFRHLRHRFSSRSVRPLVLFIIVGRVDDKVWTHLTLFLTVNPLSDHSKPLGYLVNTIVPIAFPLLIFAKFSNLLSAHVVFLLLGCKLWSLRPSRRSSFIGSISDATVCEILSLDSNIFSLAVFLAITVFDCSSVSPRLFEWIQSVEIQLGRCRISFIFALIIRPNFLASSNPWLDHRNWKSILLHITAWLAFFGRPWRTISLSYQDRFSIASLVVRLYLHDWYAALDIYLAFRNWY